MQQYTILLSISRYILSYIAFPAFPYWKVTVAVLDRLYSYKLVAKTLMKNAANCLLTWFDLILLFFLILHGKV